MEKRYTYARLANNERFMPVPNHPPPHSPPTKVKQFKHLINMQIMAFRSRMAHDEWCFPNPNGLGSIHILRLEKRSFI